MLARRIVIATLLALSPMAVAARAGRLARIPIPNCPSDSARVGQLCVDRYEASLWRIPLASKALQRRVFQGRATLEDLTRGGARQVAIAGGNDSCGGNPFPASFPADGAWKIDPEANAAFPSVVAASIEGVPPSACVTWYQAQQACAASGKRLLTVEEWRRAAIGTPTTRDNGSLWTCTTGVPVFPDNRGKPTSTGSRWGCHSAWGVYDMLGNVEEWTADLQWVGSGQVASTLGDTWNGLGGATIDVHYSRSLDFSDTATGFRCAR